MTAWVVRFDTPTAGGGASPDSGTVRVAVKDALDVAGTVTTAGCVAVRNHAVPARADAACLAGIRAAHAHIVGKTHLTELCLDPVGIHHAFATPVNPLAPDRVVGGSSSGSAVAVASGEADLALGTDTGGSVRIPAACCGIVGLKTTHGRVPMTGVWPLAPSLDTVGPMARDVAGVTGGMRLLEPGWTAAGTAPATVVGRLRVRGTAPAVDDAVDAALTAADLTVRAVDLPDWDESIAAFHSIVLAEFWRAHHRLVNASGVGRSTMSLLREGGEVSSAELARSEEVRGRWQQLLLDAFASVELLALPTLIGPPPTIDEARGFPATWLTAPFNLAGLPALSMPVPPSETAAPPVPPSLQLVAPAGREDLLCVTAAVIEAAAPTRP